MNYAELKGKYPKASKAFREWLKTNYNDSARRGILWDLYPFELQSGALEKFFDEHGLEVFISRRKTPSMHRGEHYSGGWSADISTSDYTDQDIWVGIYESRKEAQELAFTRCFELLESKLP